MSAAEYYNPSGSPGTSSQGASATMRTEFSLISTAFSKLPDLAGNAGKAVIVNPGGVSLVVTAAALTLAVAFLTAGAGAITLTSSGATNVTLPTTGTLATLAGVEVLSNKTLTAPALGTPVSGVLTNCTGTAAGLTAGNATLAATVTTNANLTGHVTSVGNAAVLGSFTLAQLNTAVNDADVASIAGAEELTNKTLTASVGKGVWTASGTWTLPAHTLGGAISGGGNQINNVVIGTSNPLAGTFTALTATGLLDLSGAGAGQISFPATQNPSAGANVLDDYEEGTWTPSVGGTATYTVQTGTYTKTGNVVHAVCNLTIAAIGTGSSSSIGGLPFTQAVGSQASASIGFFSGLTGNVVWLGAGLSSGSSSILLQQMAAAAATTSTGSVMGSGTTINLSLTYRT